MNSENGQTSTTPQPGQASMCSVSGDNISVAGNSPSPMLMQASGTMMNPHQATPPSTPLVGTPQGGAPTPTPSSTPSPMPPPNIPMQPSPQQQQQMQAQNASPMCSPQVMASQPMPTQSMGSQPMVSQSMCTPPMVTQSMCTQPMVSQSMCSVPASQSMGGSIAGSAVAVSSPVYSMTHMTQMPVSQSMCSIPVSTPVCSIPQQNMTNTTISNVHASPLPQVQVIQPGLHNQTYLQHLYAPQQQMILPGNLTIQPSMASTLQNLGAAQGLSLQLQQQKPNMEHKGPGQGPTLIPASSMQAAENYMENYQSLHGVTISSANLVSASGQMITTGAKTCMPGQMLTAAARSTAMLQGQAGFAPQGGGQTVMIGQLGMLSNQPSLIPAHNKALADSQKGKSFTGVPYFQIMNQQATLQPKSPILPQPVTSGQVLSSTQLKQLSSPQLITSQAPATMIGSHALLGSLQALGSLPQGITWTAAGGLQQSALLTPNPIFFRQQSDMFIQSPTQTMHAVPVAAATAQANVQPTQIQQQVQKPKQLKPRNRTHARSIGVQQQVMPRPLIPQMATTQTQTQTQATHIAPQIQQQQQIHQQQQQQFQQHQHQLHQQHQQQLHQQQLHQQYQQQQQQQSQQQNQQQQNQQQQSQQQQQNQQHLQQQQQQQHQHHQNQKADACNQTRPATEIRVASIQMKTTSTSTSMETKTPTTAQKIEAATMSYVNIAPAPPPQVSVAPVNIVVAQTHKMVTASTNTSPTHQTVVPNNNHVYSNTNNVHGTSTAPTIHLPPPPSLPPSASVTASTNTEKRPIHPAQPNSASIAPQPVVEEKADPSSKSNSFLPKSDNLEKRSTGTGDGDVNVNTNNGTDIVVKEKHPQKAIVKPHVLTHVIEGYIIQEGSEPFPVTRSSLLTDTSPSKLNLTNNDKPVEDDAIPTAKDAGTGKVTKKKKGLKTRKGWRKSQNNRQSYNIDEWQQQTGQPGHESQHVLIPGMESVLGDDSLDDILARKMGGAEIEGETTDTPSGPESSMSPTTPSSNREEMEVDATDGGSNFSSKNPIKWTVQEVVDFVRNLPGCSDYADEFRSQEIDGQALMLLKEDHLMTAMSMKLGPALKICARINSLRDDANR